MPLDSFLAIVTDGDILPPLIGSLIAGALIGGEREINGKAAGLRTHTLVCFASALMTLVALQMGDWSADLPADAQIVTDMSRMPHAILTGIGFLCAGVIFREGASVHGLTTAASLWLTAALGITFGTGLMELGVIGTVIALLVLMLLRLAQALAPPRPSFRLQVTVRDDGGFDGQALERHLDQYGLRAGPMALRHDRTGGLRHYSMPVAVRDRHVHIEALVRRIADDPTVASVSVAPLGRFGGQTAGPSSATDDAA